LKPRDALNDSFYGSIATAALRQQQALTLLMDDDEEDSEEEVKLTSFPLKSQGMRAWWESAE
jgi:hypothetical protein